MKYKLLIYCDVCDKHARGSIVHGAQGTGIMPPDGWGVKKWPNGDQSIVCSERCAKEVETTKSSIIVPNRGLIKN